MLVGFGIITTRGRQALQNSSPLSRARQAANSGVGRPLSGGGSGTVPEGLHLSANWFDREEPCQPPDGRMRRGIKEEVRN